MSRVPGLKPRYCAGKLFYLRGCKNTIALLFSLQRIVWNPCFFAGAGVFTEGAEGEEEKRVCRGSSSGML